MIFSVFMTISFDNANLVRPLLFAKAAPNLCARAANAMSDARIFVRGDKGVTYGRIMEVMGAISSSGFNKVALVAELPKSSDVRRP